MRLGRLAAIGVVAAGLLGGADAWAAGTTIFDGNWNLTYICANTRDGGRGFTWSLLAQIHDGSLIAQHGTKGTPDSATVMGRIDAAGEGLLRFEGLTGASGYTIGRVSPMTPFHYTADVHFGPTRGTGKRNEDRDCTLTFVKQ
jgi:hypothetical protein